MKTIWTSILGPDRLDLARFYVRVALLSLFNLIFYSLIHRARIATRVDSDMYSAAPVFGVWFFFNLVSFFLMSRWVANHWACFWAQEKVKMPRSFGLVLRAFLLSPVLAHGIALATALLPIASLLSSEVRVRKPLFAGMLICFCLISVGLSSRLPRELTGLQLAQFKRSLGPIDREAEQVMARESRTDILYLTLTPSLRYILWMGFDFFRSRRAFWALQDLQLSGCEDLIQSSPVPNSACLYLALKKSSEFAQFVSPVFPLMYLTQARGIQIQAESRELSALIPKGAEEQFEQDRLAMTLQEVVGLIDQQLALLEPSSGITKDRKALLWPAWMPILIASPEVPLVEFGQDFQRRSLFQRMEPLLRLQLQAAAEQLERTENQYIHNHSSLRTRLISLNARLAVLKGDPMGVAAAAH